MRKNVWNFLILFIFCAFILVPLITSNFTGGAVSTFEQRVTALFPKFLTESRRLNPELRSDFTNWINDNIGFRSWASKVRVYGEMKLFNVSANPKVHIGTNGWLFFTGEHNLEIASGEFKLSDEQLEKIKDNQIEIQQSLNKKGIKYVLILIPSKASVYSEYIGRRISVNETMVDTVSTYLKTHTSIPIINLKPDLLAAKNSYLVYFKNDTHWNEEGAFIGYQSIITRLNALGIIHSLPVKVTTQKSSHRGDLSVMLSDVIPPEPYTSIQIVDPKSRSILEGKDFNDLDSLLQTNGKTIDFYSYENPTAEPVKALIYGDSFFGTKNVPGLMAENFSKLDFIWSYRIMNNEIDLVHPDIVFFEMTERYIPFLEERSDPSLTISSLHN